MFKPLYLLLFLLHACPGSAVTWYFLRYNTPRSEEFTSFSGTMHVPPLPKKATYYLWPGLQPTDASGVYQNVLDGRSGAWWIGSGWCCKNPNLPWGNGFKTHKGESVVFSNVKGESGWTSTLTKTSASVTTGEATKNSFALSSKSFNQALFAIELYDVKWDFGPLTFTNVTITSTGSDSTWCSDSPENWQGSTKFTVSGVMASARNGSITCNVATVTLIAPAK